MIEYQLIRSKRKTLSIQIDQAAKVIVKAPLRLSLHEIEAFLAQKQQWILQAQARIAAAAEHRAVFDPIKSGGLLFLGQEYPVCQGLSTHFDGTQFWVTGECFAACKTELIELYKRLAKQIITEKVKKHSQIMQLFPAGIKITDANTRWGSCSGKNRLCFSWKLIFAPPDAVDYVVIHELSHIKEHNHSPQFWMEAARFCPDFQKQREALKLLAKRLEAENWETEKK